MTFKLVLMYPNRSGHIGVGRPHLKLLQRPEFEQLGVTGIDVPRLNVQEYAGGYRETSVAIPYQAAEAPDIGNTTPSSTSWIIRLRV